MKLVFIILFLCSISLAEGAFLIHPTEISISMKKFTGQPRNALFRYYGLKEDPIWQMEWVMNFDVLLYGYWNNKFVAISNDTQFRTAGWNFQTGIHIFDFLDVFYEHYSQHVLDYNTTNSYPIEDWVGVKIHIINEEKRRYNVLVPW